ncbi:MAG: hypothetical protein C0598_01615 [Marinilabiliales bacterium]|nr:MAG: hypothetical protein C0598_01615 [Marinilabiliales bacterium]
MLSEQTLVSGIEHKVRKLIEKNVYLVKENKRLISLIKEMEDEKSEIESELSSKKNKIFNYTIANTLELEYGVEEGRQKIDSLLEEIDKCIEVLSD